MARISAAEAQNRIAQYLKDKTGKGRRIPPINQSIQDIMCENTVHVFNVGPWGYRENMGSFGYYFIPKCEVGAPMEWERLKAGPVAAGVYVPDHWEEGERRVTDPHAEYAAMKPLPGLMAEPLPKEIDECTWNLQDEGRYFANELLGVGIGHSQQNSHVRRGCFVAAGKKPTEKDLVAARAELMKTAPFLIRANSLAPRRPLVSLVTGRCSEMMPAVLSNSSSGTRATPSSSACARVQYLS